jgi:hypothetical protein
MGHQRFTNTDPAILAVLSFKAAKQTLVAETFVAMAVRVAGPTFAESLLPPDMPTFHSL